MNNSLTELGSASDDQRAAETRVTLGRFPSRRYNARQLVRGVDWLMGSLITVRFSMVFGRASVAPANRFKTRIVGLAHVMDIEGDVNCALFCW
jgi:hypothetical protein